MDQFLRKQCQFMDTCPLYGYVNSIYRQNDDNAYTPLEYDDIKHRIENKAIATLDQIIFALYGKHCCRIKDMELLPVNKQVVDSIRASYDLQSNEPIFSVCYRKWFRRLMPLLPVKNFIEQKVEVREKIVNWQQAAKLNELATYFAGNDEFSLFKEPINKNYDVVYNNDYMEFVRVKYSRREIFEFHREQLRLRGDHCYDSYLERAFEMISVIVDAESKTFVIYDDEYASMSTVCALKGFSYHSYMSHILKREEYFQMGLNVCNDLDDIDKMRGDSLVVIDVSLQYEEKEAFVFRSIETGMVVTSKIEPQTLNVVMYSRNCRLYTNDRLVIRDEKDKKLRSEIKMNRCIRCEHYRIITGEMPVLTLKCMDCQQIRNKQQLKVLKFGDGDITDFQHRRNITGGCFSYSQRLKRHYGNFFHARKFPYWYSLIDDFCYILKNKFSEYISHISVGEKWDGMNLVFFRYINIAGQRIGIYKDRDKMSLLEIESVVENRLGMVLMEDKAYKS